METRQEETQDFVIFNLKISKKQVKLMRIYLTITSILGVILFFVKHS